MGLYLVCFGDGIADMKKIEQPDAAYKPAVPWLALIFGVVSFAFSVDVLFSMLFFVSEYDPHAVAYLIAVLISLFAGLIIAPLSITFGRTGLRQKRGAKDGNSRRDRVFSFFGVAGGTLFLISVLVLIVCTLIRSI